MIFLTGRNGSKQSRTRAAAPRDPFSHDFHQSPAAAAVHRRLQDNMHIVGKRFTPGEQQQLKQECVSVFIKRISIERGNSVAGLKHSTSVNLNHNTSHSDDAKHEIAILKTNSTASLHDNIADLVQRRTIATFIMIVF